MIPISKYQQFIAELVNVAKQRAEITESHTTRLAVTETQLINLLKDQRGIVIAGKIPDAEISKNSYVISRSECLLMVLEKMPEDEQGLQRETDRLARLQRLMDEIVKILMNYDGFDRFCDLGEVDRGREVRVEWEYNTYGGFNGMSVVFWLRDRAIDN